jgi:hypothetical protein
MGPWHVIEGGRQDSVVRRERFAEAHPDVDIQMTLGLWEARRAGRRIAGPCYWLDDLLDRLEENS